MIDWDLAISTGTRWARPGPQVSLAEARRTVTELRDLAGAVQQPVYEVTGMSANGNGSLGRVAVVDRPGWIRANVDGFRVVLEPLVEIAPELRHPAMHQTARELLAAVSDQRVRRTEIILST